MGKGGPVLLLLKLMVLSSNLLASSRALRRPTTRRSRTTTGQDLRTITSSRARTRVIKAELTVWVVSICFVWVESVVDRTAAWAIPFYSQIKIVVLLFLWALKRVASHFMLTHNAGSQIVFKQIKRYMRRYEGPIDAVGYALGQVIDVLFAAIVFLPSLLWGKWVASRQPDVPSILAGLNSPRRGPMANRLAAAVHKSTSTSTADATNRIKVTAQTVFVLPPSKLAPSAKLKRTASTPVLVEPRLKPILSSSSDREQSSLLSSTSSQAGPIASSSSSLYPSLVDVTHLSLPTQPSVPALGHSTSRPRVISDRQKGKQRAAEEVSDGIPLETPSVVEPPPRSPSATPKKTSRRRSSPRKSTLPTDVSPDAEEHAQVEIQVEEPPQVNTPRASPVHSTVFPQTPAPPGAFVSTPFANKTLGSTARQQASSALKGLADDLLGLGEEPRPIGASPLASRNTGLLNGKASVAKRSGSSLLQKVEATKSSEEERGTERVSDRLKRKAVRAPSVEPAPPVSKRRIAPSLSSSTSRRQLGSSNALSASTRIRSSALASSVSGASRRTRTRGRVGEDSSSSTLSKSTLATSTSKPPTLKAPDKELLPPLSALNRTADPGASSLTTGTGTASKRRAKRVLGRGASVDIEDEQVEMDGVPVVKRRR